MKLTQNGEVSGTDAGAGFIDGLDRVLALVFQHHVTDDEAAPAVLRVNDLIVVGLTDLDVVDVPRDLGGRRGRHAALENCLLAVDDHDVRQRQLEDGRHQRQRRDVALVGTPELGAKPMHHL